MVKYAPKKVFILEKGNYKEITYSELKQLEQADKSYMDKFFLPLHGMLMEVTKEAYKEYYRDKRRQKYIDERSKAHGDISYNSFDTDELLGEDILVDKHTDVEAQVISKMTVEKLQKAFLLLSPDEKALGDVYSLFCGEYCWSPAYNDVYKDFGFEDVEINCSEKNNYINKTIGRIRPLYNSAIWEKSFDYSINGAISILMPDKLLVEKLGLTQLQNGVWIKDGEIVCADFSHIKGSNIDGLYIKKKYFDIFLLSANYDVVWIGLGEKIHNKGLVQRRAFKALSSLVYNENEKLIEINHVNDI